MSLSRARLLHRHQTVASAASSLPEPAPSTGALKMCRRATDKCDVYSLGVVIWEIVTSAMPQVGLLVWRGGTQWTARLPAVHLTAACCFDIYMRGCLQ